MGSIATSENSSLASYKDEHIPPYDLAIPPTGINTIWVNPREIKTNLH